MFNVKSRTEVFEIIKNNFTMESISTEKISLYDSLGRITSQDIFSKENLPSFNRSSVDGYAVKAFDTFGSSDSVPSILKLVGEVMMGDKPHFTIGSGEAAYVPTGGEIPQGADSMVMIEYTEDYSDGFINILKASSPGGNVVMLGDDILANEIAIKASHKIRPQDMGILAALGYEEIPVKRRLNIGIISTGDEVVAVNAKITGAQVRDVNTFTIYGGLLEMGINPRVYGIIKDDFGIMKNTLLKALDECDAVLISGGSSVGTRDQTLNVIEAIKRPEDAGVLVHGIAIKPGKPTIIGKIKDKAVFGLPGHPASAYFIFKIIVGWYINAMNGIDDAHKTPSIQVILDVNYPSNAGREEYLPVSIYKENGITKAKPIFGKSGLITTLSRADGYIHIDRNKEGLAMGSKVNVLII